MKRAVELLGLHKRRYFSRAQATRARATSSSTCALSRMEPVAVSRERFDKTSAPMWMSLADEGDRARSTS